MRERDRSPCILSVVDNLLMLLCHRPNLFGPRRIRKPTYSNPTLVHSSVKTRLKYYRDVYGRPYKNKAKFPSGVIEWVDEWALPENDR